MSGSKVLLTLDTLTAIANAIRAKTGRSSLITPNNMPSEIASIASGTTTEVTLDYNWEYETGTVTASSQTASSLEIPASFEPSVMVLIPGTYSGASWTAMAATNNILTVLYFVNSGNIRQTKAYVVNYSGSSALIALEENGYWTVSNDGLTVQRDAEQSTNFFSANSYRWIAARYLGSAGSSTAYTDVSNSELY